MVSAPPSDLPDALREPPPPGSAPRALLARGMPLPVYAALRLRRLWLRLRFGRRLAIDRRAFVGARVRLEIGRGARLALGPWTWVGGESRLRVRSGELRVGQATALGRGCAVVAHGHVAIGTGCRLGDRAMLLDAEPRTDDVERPLREQGIRVAAVRVGDRVRIGPHACVLAGVTLGDDSAVAPRAVVTSDVPPGAATSGVPARPRWPRTAARSRPA